ncbi:MAG: hypothetical protein IPO21_14640 [Bacteroidales bacterium]|nr:hypothetical protein [Bacteroidales bacterium]
MDKCRLVSPANGLIVYNSTEMAYYYFNGSIWAKIGTVGKTLRDADNDTYIQVEESANEDIIRVDIGNNFGATYENKVTISSTQTVIEGDYTIPNGNTLKLGATPFIMPATAGNKGTVMATDGTGNWSWMEAHGGLGIASGVQTLYFAETTSLLAISNNTYYTPVIPFSSITVDTLKKFTLVLLWVLHL